MKQLTFCKTILSAVIIMLIAPISVMADPAGPGDGSDPFATPVNGGVAFVAAMAFLYGVYRIYQITKKNRAENTDR